MVFNEIKTAKIILKKNQCTAIILNKTPKTGCTIVNSAVTVCQTNWFVSKTEQCWPENTHGTSSVTLS